MNARRLFTVIGAGSTTFLLVAVALIEVLDVAFSAIIGIPVGVVAGLALSVGLWIALEELRVGVRRAVSAYAAFGLTVLTLLTLRYVNVGRRVLSVDVVAGVGVGAVVVVYMLLSLSDRDSM